MSAGTKERIIVKPVDSAVVSALAAQLGITAALAAILAGRGLTTFESCRSYFRPSLDNMHDPFLFADMKKAVARIVSAIDKQERITVYGDYDADGVTATALLVRALRTMGAQCDYFIPNRLTDGYGLSAGSIRAVCQGQANLVITVDCGITAVDEVALANSLGTDVIITDHHEPKDVVPDACALLNPKLRDAGYPDKNLAGVGVALKLVQALCKVTGANDDIWKDQLDLAAVGTAADIVPLTGENRIIAHVGFQQLDNTQNIGLAALIREQGITSRPLTTHHVVFLIAPCINASGRLGDSRRGVDLLLTDDEAAARVFAAGLKQANHERQALDAIVKEEAFLWIVNNCTMEHDYAIVAGKEEWHVGVVGIVASKVVERFSRPAILFSVGPDGLARGSGRSIPSIHLLEALNECRDCLQSFGGHAAAAGMTIRTEMIPLFRERFNQVIRSRITADDLVPTVGADVEVTLDEINTKFINIVRQMEPFGPGNMRPVLLCRGLKNKYEPRIVGDSHLKLSVTGKGVVMDAIGFGFGHRLADCKQTTDYSLAFCLDENEWNGVKRLQMKIKGVHV